MNRLRSLVQQYHPGILLWPLVVLSAVGAAYLWLHDDTRMVLIGLSVLGFVILAWVDLVRGRHATIRRSKERPRVADIIRSADMEDGSKLNRGNHAAPRHPSVEFQPGLVTLAEGVSRPDILSGFVCRDCRVQVGYTPGQLASDDVVVLHDFFALHHGHQLYSTHFDNRSGIATASEYERGLQEAAPQERMTAEEWDSTTGDGWGDNEESPK